MTDVDESRGAASQCYSSVLPTSQVWCIGYIHNVMYFAYKIIQGENKCQGRNNTIMSYVHSIIGYFNTVWSISFAWAHELTCLSIISIMYVATLYKSGGLWLPHCDLFGRGNEPTPACFGKYTEKTVQKHCSMSHRNSAGAHERYFFLRQVSLKR